MSTRTRAVVHDVLPALLPEVFPGFGEGAPLELPALSAKVEHELAELLTSGDFDAWSQALARVGNCAGPIRLRGRSETIDVTTGEMVATYSSEQEPLGITHLPCGNRRASEGPSCSRLYAADMFQLIRAEFEWVKTHTYRKTVATLLDQSGASARMIADQLGHSRVSMTQDVYLGRRAANAGNLAALEAYNPDRELDPGVPEGEK